GVVLGRGALLLPVWWASIILVGTRAAPTFVIVPMALLVGAAAVEITWWVAWCAERLRSRSGTLLGIRFTVVTVLVAVMIVGLASGLAVGPGQGREGDFLQALTPA